jgi:hypothetical protein
MVPRIAVVDAYRADLQPVGGRENDGSANILDLEETQILDRPQITGLGVVE